MIHISQVHMFNCCNNNVTIVRLLTIKGAQSKLINAHIRRSYLPLYRSTVHVLFTIHTLTQYHIFIVFFFRIHSRRTYLLNRRWRRVRQKCLSVVRVHKLITRVFSLSPRPNEQVKNNHVQVENIYLPSQEVPITLCRNISHTYIQMARQGVWTRDPHALKGQLPNH